MRILVIKLSSLGDLFHALPAVHNLKVALNATVDWVVNREYVELVRCFTDVDRVIPFFRRSFFKDFSRFVKVLRAEEYDYIVDFQGLMKSAITGRLARGARRIGPSFYREHSDWFYSAVAGVRNKERHAVEENMDIVRHLHLKETPAEFPVRFPEHKIDESHTTRVAMLPVSRWATKNWPAEYFAETGRRLVEETGAWIYLIGGGADVRVLSEVEKGIGANVRNLAGRLNISATGGLLNRMHLLISNDSGPVHLAAAIGVPCMVFFGPTDAARTGPYGSAHRVLSSDVECRPCFSRTCERGDMRCMNDITPDDAVTAALEMLSGRVPQ